MNIIVLAGGISSEREISISTGSKVCQALTKKGHHTALLDVYFGTRCPEKVFTEDYDFEKALQEINEYSKTLDEAKKTRRVFWGPHVMELCQKADVVFLALHGENGENGKVQASFDLFGVRYTGTGYLGSALAMDKGLSKNLFVQNGIPTPRGITLNKKDCLEDCQIDLTFPCIVKPSCGGSSVGVMIAEHRGELEQALKEAFSYENEVVVEEYIKGREFSVGIVDHEAYPVIEIVPKTGFYDYKNKYQAGATDEYCPARISEEAAKKLQECALKAAEVLLLDKYCRIDFMMDEQERIYCLEANTLPGMTDTSLLPQEAAVLGIDYGTLCEKLIEVSSDERN